MFPMEVEFHSEKMPFLQGEKPKSSGCRPTQKQGKFLILFVFGRGGAREKRPAKEDFPGIS
jgi:hypothetical protein